MDTLPYLEGVVEKYNSSQGQEYWVVRMHNNHENLVWGVPSRQALGHIQQP